MSDIARKSGVHASTVSAVLAGKTKERRISKDAATRVLAAAAEMDFALVLNSYSRTSYPSRKEEMNGQ